MQSYFLVGLGGAIGAMGRYGFGVMVGRLHAGSFPFATLGVNVIGSLAMGLLIGLLAKFTPAWQGDIRLFVAVGMFGGFTTFSSFSLDAVTLIERGQVSLAVLYALASVVVSVMALFGGLLIVRGLPI